MVRPSFGTKSPTLLLSGILWVKLHFILVFIAFTVQMDKIDSSDCDSNDSYDSDDSVTSSVFGFTEKNCYLRAIKQTHLEDQFLQDVVFMSYLDNDIWVKCNNCESAFHKLCWKSYGDNVPVCFVCCKCHGLGIIDLYLNVQIRNSKQIHNEVLHHIHTINLPHLQL